MDVFCPQCYQTLLWQQGNIYHCATCDKGYLQVAPCPECNKPLDKMQACGAVDYFCQHGHGLVSKKRLHFIYVEQE